MVFPCVPSVHVLWFCRFSYAEKIIKTGVCIDGIFTVIMLDKNWPT